MQKKVKVYQGLCQGLGEGKEETLQRLQSYGSKQKVVTFSWQTFVHEARDEVQTTGSPTFNCRGFFLKFGKDFA